MLLLRYDGSGWEEVAGSEASTDGALVCADGMSSFSPFAVGHKDSRPAFADDAAIGALVFPVDAVIEPVELPAVREGTGDGEIGYALTPALPAGLTREGRRLSGTPAEAFAQRRLHLDGHRSRRGFALDLEAWRREHGTERPGHGAALTLGARW